MAREGRSRVGVAGRAAVGDCACGLVVAQKALPTRSSVASPGGGRHLGPGGLATPPAARGREGERTSVTFAAAPVVASAAAAALAFSAAGRGQGGW